MWGLGGGRRWFGVWGPVGGRRDVLPDHVRFADPAALGVREHDGDGVACALEVADKGQDVGGCGVRGRAVVVGHLAECVRSSRSIA